MGLYTGVLLMRVLALPLTAVVGMTALPLVAVAQSFDVTIRNAGKAVLVCEVSLAHWYSDKLGEVAPGGTFRFRLHADVRTGMVSRRNSEGADMPVERLWCGLKGKSWVTRSEIGLVRQAGVTAADMVFDCAAVATGTICSRP